MRIAIFHNFMDNIGGAEVVDLLLARELDADIYTTNIDQQKIIKMGFDPSRIKSIGKIPLNAPFRQELASWKFRRLNLGRQYDFYIIAGDWAMTGAIHNQPNLWYVYSPTREIFDLYRYTREHTVPAWKRPFFDLWVIIRRWLTRRDSRQIKNIVCISQTVQNRIKKYLDRDSAIIYPPTETEKFYYRQNGDFWLSVNRLTNHKRLEIQLEAFRHLPNEKLIIVGSYEEASHFRYYAEHIIKNKPANVEILSWVDQKQVIDLYADCKGFITTALDEDFGLTVIEAMAAGKPVIAPNEGGYQETVLDEITGRLISDIDAPKLVQAIKDVGLKPERYKEACQQQARKFDTRVFLAKIKEIIYGQ